MQCLRVPAQRQVWKARVLMIFRNFLAWAQTAPAASRAEGASALARAYLEAELSEEDRSDAEIALTSLLDDPAISVRRALAIELAGSPYAPRHVISALASDQSGISVPVLSRSPLLSEAELCDCAVIGDVYAQAAIALRPGLPEAVAWVIADRGEREAVISLAVNLCAYLAEPILGRILERHGEDGEVREAILARGDLPASIRSDLVTATANALSSFVISAGWMTAERAGRTCRETLESGVVEIAAGELQTGNLQVGGNLPLGLVHHLRQQEQLTPALILRGLLSGNRSLFEATLCELSGQGPERVKGFVAAWSGAGFAALYARANLPPGLLPVFRAALAAQDDYGLIYVAEQRPQLSKLLIEGTLRALEAMAGPPLGRVIALLHRLRAEVARTEARAMSTELIASSMATTLAPPVENPPAIALELEAGAEADELAVAA